MKGHPRETILIAKNIIMRWSTRPEKTTVTLQIEVKLRGVSHLAVDHCASWAISAPVSITWVLGEEPDVVSFSDNNDGDLWRNLQVGTGELQGFEF